MGPSNTYREAGQGGASPSSFEPGRPLSCALLYRSCEPAELPFELVGELEDLLESIGQERAVEAVEFAVTMRHKGVQRLCARRQRYRQAHHGPRSVEPSSRELADAARLDSFAAKAADLARNTALTQART